MINRFLIAATLLFTTLTYGADYTVEYKTPRLGFVVNSFATGSEASAIFVMGKVSELTDAMSLGILGEVDGEFIENANGLHVVCNKNGNFVIQMSVNSGETKEFTLVIKQDRDVVNMFNTKSIYMTDCPVLQDVEFPRKDIRVRLVERTFLLQSEPSSVPLTIEVIHD